jgi:DNA repair exonuclease SbcCD ATPase subunit
MKLTHLQIGNFMGVREIDVPLSRPITLFAGRNGAGKSSVMEAVQMALIGETARVPLRKSFALIVNDGKDSGYSTLAWEGGEASIVLPSGKCKNSGGLPNELPAILDAQRFARMEANHRRVFLFSLMGLYGDSKESISRLLGRGCDAETVKAITPFLRAGFDIAQKEAAAKAREGKAVWRQITGETYGKDKAATWEAAGPACDTEKLDESSRRLADCERDIAGINESLGALRAAKKSHEKAMARLSELREKGARHARVADKLAHDESELKVWEEKLEQVRMAANGGRKHGLIHDLAAALEWALSFVQIETLLDLEKEKLEEAEVALDAYRSEHGDISVSNSDPEAATRLPEYEKAFKLLQNSVANDKRDLADAEAAAAAIKEAEAAVGQAPDTAGIEKLEARLSSLTEERKKLSAEFLALRDAEKTARHAKEKTATARAAHEAVANWTKIADALAPDGIPGEILADALAPINERMACHSEIWGPVIIDQDMGISYAGRDYSLLSESEKWRADALIAEAISHLSGIKLLVLDRFDVLDIDGRADLLYWLDDLAKIGQIDSALLFGTLKALPAKLPESAAAYWLDGGKVATIKEAA